MYGEKNQIKKVMLFLTMFLIASLMTSTSSSSSEINLSKGQAVYVPVYSHIYCGDRERPFDLAVTLSIRNTDQNHTITIDTVKYYNSEGKLLRNFIDKPVQLNALGSIRYVIKETDKSGGSGAKFIVEWKSEKLVNIPIIESIMIGTGYQQGISFTSRGQIIKGDTDPKK